MSLIVSWALFPLVLAALGLGWGVLVERAAAVRLQAVLLAPLGLAAVIVLAGTLTSFSATAKAAVPVVALGALLGLAFAWPRGRLTRWPLLAAAAAVLVYGAPVILSGEATFAGFIKLDDTATWFNVVDVVLAHGHSTAGLPSSTFALLYNGDVGSSYPVGAFMLPGVARSLVRTDVAWVFQPYLACCGAAVALSAYALLTPIASSTRLRALLSFLAAQPALLYGYSLWGGIKELTAAFLLALGVALAAPLLTQAPPRPRRLLPLAVAAGALIVTLGPGAAGWIVPALACLLAGWLWLGGERRRRLRPALVSVIWLAGLTALFAIPVWVVLGTFLGGDSGLFSSGQSTATQLGNLLHPLSPFQLAGIWPVGDFRSDAPTLPTVLLVGVLLATAAVGVWMGVRRRQLGPALYVFVALAGCAAIYLAGATPWVVGKTLAISSPALLTAAMAGVAVLVGRRRIAVLVLLALAAGVLWSNALAYHSAQLAPRQRLSELEHIDGLLAGKGPTLLNEYEVYADRHFLREGAPVEPAEYRSVFLPLREGTLLTKSAWSDLDSLPLTTLLGYRSIVTRRSPVESRPPSLYRLAWSGRYYQLWQRPASPSLRILEHVPLGESSTLPYCGNAQNGAAKPECSIDPVATPTCASVQRLGRTAQREGARLVAYQRPAPIVARGDQTLWPGGWLHDPEAHTLTPTAPGTAVSHIAVAGSERYTLWLGGSFERGFEVSVDGERVGRVKDELSAFGGYVEVAELDLEAGVHTIALTYPQADLTPGSGAGLYTSLQAIALEPHRPPAGLLSVAPAQTRRLCGRPLDWIELVAPA
ncbi:MAG TPA: hypothetical protein VFW38_01205 [Solirubrobacteraceae bacterium]|nr:hypothetical protein [Solirubrobacteraceae bacterium]